MKEDLLEKIQAADMILIGLGEEFDELHLCKKEAGYQEGKKILEDADKSFLLPVYHSVYRKKDDERVKQVLEKLAESIADKNYFVVATSENEIIRKIPWRQERLTLPCGGFHKKQCVRGCKEGLTELGAEEQESLSAQMREFCEFVKQGRSYELSVFDDVLGKCPGCGAQLILNNVYTEHYDENGYLESWQKYRNWLQGTLNRKLLILELGVGLWYPTVIRWPFEKMAFYNQKSVFYRVHESLYQLTEDLQGKAVSIAKNSIDWLESMC
ncbi:MAG: hypothetical protein J6C84_08490 [Lachnospiraceae bacterium]|nr:hypothetical protein [Lachnospiraceae bacterium]